MYGLLAFIAACVAAASSAGIDDSYCQEQLPTACFNYIYGETKKLLDNPVEGQNHMITGCDPEIATADIIAACDALRDSVINAPLSDACASYIESDFGNQCGMNLDMVKNAFDNGEVYYMGTSTECAKDYTGNIVAKCEELVASSTLSDDCKTALKSDMSMACGSTMVSMYQMYADQGDYFYPGGPNACAQDTLQNIIDGCATLAEEIKSTPISDECVSALKADTTMMYCSESMLNMYQSDMDRGELTSMSTVMGCYDQYIGNIVQACSDIKEEFKNTPLSADCEAKLSDTSTMDYCSSYADSWQSYLDTGSLTVPGAPMGCENDYIGNLINFCAGGSASSGSGGSGKKGKKGAQRRRR